MNKSDALDTLLDLKKIFDSISLEYWLTDGTLLGLHREGDFINHDKDIDVGIFIENWLKHPNALKLISQSGFKLNHQFGEKDCGYEISIIKRNIKIDLFFFYKNSPPARYVSKFDEEKFKNIYWSACWKNAGGDKRKMIVYKYEPFKLVQKTFKNNTFNVPDDVEKYIIQQYGPNWRIKDTNWKWDSSPFNLIQTEIIVPVKKLQISQFPMQSSETQTETKQAETPQNVLFGTPMYDWTASLRKIKNSYIEDFSTKDKLLEIIRSKDIKAVIPCSFDQMKFLAQVDRNDDVKILSCDSYDSVDICNDKIRFNEFMRNNFSDFIPRTYTPTNVNFPVIFKHAKTSSGIGSSVCHNKAELDKSIKNSKKAYIIQEYILDRTEYAGNMLVKNGNILYSIYYTKTYDQDFHILRGSMHNQKGTYQRISSNLMSSHEKETFSKILVKLNFTGFLCFDFKIKNNKVKIFEINPRLGGTLIRNTDHLNEMINAIKYFKPTKESGHLESERAEGERAERERAERERAERERAERERAERERAERERLEKERLEKARLEKERLEKARLEKERLEKARFPEIEKYKPDNNRLENNRLENNRLENNRLERDRLERDRLERDRLERDRLERDRLERDRLERDRLEKVKSEKSKLEKSKSEKSKSEKSKSEKERLEMIRLGKDKLKKGRFKEIEEYRLQKKR